MRTMNYIGLGLILALLLACQKDNNDAACAKLAGIWQCESWKEDDQEFLGVAEVITSSEINFVATSEKQGTYQWDISFLIGGSEIIIGGYTLNEDCDQVTLTPKGGGVESVYNFHFEGELLILDGTINTIAMDLQFRTE